MQTGGGLGGPGGRNGGAAPGWPRTPLSKSLPLTADLGLLLGSAWAHARAHGRHPYACLAHSGDPCTQLLGGSQPVFVSCLLRLLPHLPLPSRISHLTQRPSASPHPRVVGIEDGASTLCRTPSLAGYSGPTGAASPRLG